MAADATLSIIPRLFDTVVRRWGPQGEGLNVQIVMRERPCGIRNIKNLNIMRGERKTCCPFVLLPMLYK